MWWAWLTSVKPSAHSAAITKPAPARMSVARTGAPERRSRPRTTACLPSVRISAPSRTSSWTNVNRAVEHVLRDHRGALADGGQAERHRQQVGGEAGNGRVTMSSARGRRSMRTRKPSTYVSTLAPAVATLSSAISR